MMSKLYSADELRAIAQVLDCLGQANNDDTHDFFFTGQIDVDRDGFKMGVVKVVEDSWYYAPATKGDFDE
jgi:hypothetical protein